MRWLHHVSLNLSQELRDKLSLIDAQRVKQVTVRALVGASGDRAGAEAWFSRLRLRVCN